MGLQATLNQVSSHKTGDMEHSVAVLPGWATSGVIEPEIGWLLCNGATITNTGKYAALFALLGSSYGASGKLPTLIEGVQPTSKGASGYTTLGATDGAANVSLVVSQISNHIHSYNNETIEVFVGSYGWMAYNDPPGTGDGGQDSYIFTTGATGGGGSHNNMPPYVVIEGMLVKL